MTVVEAHFKRDKVTLTSLMQRFEAFALCISMCCRNISRLRFRLREVLLSISHLMPSVDLQAEKKKNIAASGSHQRE